MDTENTEINWNEDRPSKNEIDQFLKSMVINPIELIEDERIATFLITISDKYSNGDTLFKQFSIEPNAVFNWFTTRNRLNEIDFLKCFLTSEEAKASLPQLTDIDNIKILDENCEIGVFNLPGNLAKLIYLGGAYSELHSDSEEAFHMATDFIKAISNNKFEHACSWHFHTAWTPWFYGLAWDHTYVIFDKLKNVVTLFCLTDSD